MANRIILKENGLSGTAPDGYKFLGYTGDDLQEKTGATAVSVGPVSYVTDSETITGQTFDGKDIYSKTLSGSTFAVASSYGRVAHGLNMATAKIIEVEGYVDYAANSTAAMYANYFDATNFYWYWTDSANLPYRLIFKYTKD